VWLHARCPLSYVYIIFNQKVFKLWKSTCAGKSISSESSYASAVETTVCIRTVSELSAVPVVHSTFIYVCNTYTYTELSKASRNFGDAINAN